MAATETTDVMTEEGRALLTPRERDILRGDADVSDNYRYKVESLVRNRIRKRFSDDVDILESRFPEVFEMIESDVCGEVFVDVDGDDLRGRLQDALEARDDAQNRAALLGDELDDCREQLEAARSSDIDTAAIRRAVDDLEAACERGDGGAVQDAIGRLRETIGDV